MLSANSIAGSQVSLAVAPNVYTADGVLLLAVGNTDGGTGLGNIGIEPDSWDETHGITIGGAAEVHGGAVFWMDPVDATPARADQTDAVVTVVLAHFTIPAGDIFEVTFGAESRVYPCNGHHVGLNGADAPQANYRGKA
jgi:hypothetical protein